MSTSSRDCSMAIVHSPIVPETGPRLTLFDSRASCIRIQGGKREGHQSVTARPRERKRSCPEKRHEGSSEPGGGFEIEIEVVEKSSFVILFDWRRGNCIGRQRATLASPATRSG